MNSLWARIKPLLARVTQPARDIGCEIGVASHRQALVTVRWLLVSPDTNEFGVSSQGLQVHHELKTERDTCVATRTPRTRRHHTIQRDGMHVGSPHERPVATRALMGCA